ncbi:MAG: ABC transporter permease [Deltaproteobacteria bacterium]|nr:ABC transporter permease [Deltaproteobacteria bacterium]
MLQFIHQCWRDLWRNLRRSILVGLVMIFSVAMMVLFVAFGDGAHTQMIRGATDSFLGQVQVQARGYMDEPDLEHRIKAGDLARVMERLVGVDGVKGFAPRLAMGGLISKKVPDPKDPDDLDAWREMTSEGAFLVGVDPKRERIVSNLGLSLVADDPADRCVRGCRAALAEVWAESGRCEGLCRTVGSGFDGEGCAGTAEKVCAKSCDPADDLCDQRDCLDRFADYCSPARFLAPAAPDPDNLYRGEIVLGAGLAGVLEVGVGDRVAMMTGTAKGRTFGSLYRVVGLVKTASLDINRTFALTHLDKLARGLEVPGAATSVVIAVDDLDGADRIAAGIGRLLKGDMPDLRALSWRQLAPELDVFVKMDQGSLLIMLGLMVMIVGVILANVVTMSVMERTREYGVRLAMGEQPARITGGLIVEVALLALVASGIGAAIGEGLNFYYISHGVDFGMGEIETAGVLLNTVYHTEFTVYGLVFSIGIVVGFAVVGSLIPAWRIRRLKPVEALRFV